MAYEYSKAKPVALRDIGKDEKWLQELIARDPSVLNLGDVELFRKELKQPSGGRIDMVLRDAASEVPIHYEVEIMLGRVDESHIIRTIEYWDVERRRYPAFEHRAVIIAEDITNRFFNVIGLLNKSIPLIAIKLFASVLDDKLSLSFIKVMDVVAREDLVPDDEAAGPVDRAYWTRKGRAKALAIIDAFLAQLAHRKDVRAKYNRGHFVIGTSGVNFLWMMPRKGDYVSMQADVGETRRDEFVKRLTSRDIEAREHSNPATITVAPTLADIQQNGSLFQEIFEAAEALSHE